MSKIANSAFPQGRREAPLTHELVVAAQEVRLPHQDPADRFLAATAEALGLTPARLVHELFLQHQAAGIFRAQPLTSGVWEKALVLAQRYSAKLGARTLDRLHVASVLILRPDVFYTFDKRQHRLAKAEQLRVLPA